MQIYLFILLTASRGGVWEEIPREVRSPLGPEMRRRRRVAEWQVIKASLTVDYLPGPGPALPCRLTTETPEAEGLRRYSRPANLVLHLPPGPPHQSHGLSQAETGKDSEKREGHMQRPELALSLVTESSQQALREASLYPFCR